MKVKLTPLNIVSAICLVVAVLILLGKKDAPHQPGAAGFTWLMVGFAFFSAIVAFISDMIFRKFIPSLKKLWIIEGVLVIFTLILIFIIKVSTN